MGKHVHENLATLRGDTPRHATYRNVSHPRPAQVELASSLREGDVTKPVPCALPTFQAGFMR